jgi:hypothetical protein
VNDHFSPSSALFSPKDRLDIIWSDIGFFAALSCVIYAVYAYGLANVAKFYLMPYMVVNYHLVLITFLQHTDIFIPHFRGKVSQAGAPPDVIITPGHGFPSGRIGLSSVGSHFLENTGRWTEGCA